jgi:hypothetical protein
MHSCLVLALLAAGPDLSGRWEGGGITLVLAANGSGTISDGPQVPPEALTWRLAGNVLAMTQGGDTIPYQVSRLERDSMTLSSVVLDAPITLRRVGAAAKGAPQTSRPQILPSQPQTPAAPLESGSCAGACRHYATCAKLGLDVVNVCTVQCFSSGATPMQLETYVRLDCDRAIMVMVAAQLQALQATQQQAQGNRGGQRNTSAQCKGCVRDGNDCVWISQSNWGTGNNSPYSGAVSSCDPSCCGM